MPHFSTLRITPEFRAAVRADERGIVKLALLLGLNNYTSLSTLVNCTTRFTGTPLRRQRLDALAQLIGFTGEVYRG
jgi:hypothetical protein